jgi:hypothetical protein
MAKKPKVEVDEGLVRQVIAGQLPLTTKVTREIEDPAQQEPQAEPDVVVRDSEEEQDIPTPAPEPRRRRTMVIPDFEQTYMIRHDIHVRSALYVSIDTKRKVLDVVKKIGSEYMTATSYVENIVRQHLELYKDDINRIYKQKSTQNLI